MARVLMAWELGMNLGHLARLAPVAEALVKRGHTVRVLARALSPAVRLFEPLGVTVASAPVLAQAPELSGRLSGYADILLSQGWGDASTLAGLISVWLERFRAFAPDVVILDHAPTARLAARIAGVPALALGNGFELPPDGSPLPPFADVPGATLTQAAAADQVALASAQQVLASFAQAKPITLAELLRAEATCLATFPELDHYGPRSDACYVGPLIGQLPVQRMDWPTVDSPRVFACLRPDTRQVEAVLGGLATSGASVLGYTPQFPAEILARLTIPRLHWSEHLLDLTPLVTTADTCVSYGAEGTVTRFLLAGVPQILIPGHAEALMAAHRLEALGAALVLRGRQTSASVATALHFLIDQPSFRRCAEAFATRHRDWKPIHAVNGVLTHLAAITPLLMEPCCR